MPLGFEHIGPAPVSPLATEHMVRMRDGARLATDVYLPEGLDGTTEAVLVRLPYDKCGDYCFMPRLAPLFTAAGYAFVVQDVRGKFRSEGEDLFVRLLDVDPDGAARYVARGQVVVDPAREDTPVRVSLCHTGYLLQAGHALRLHVAGSDFPEYVPHPGTGENRWLARETQTNEQTLRLGGDQPARLTITVLP
jgi:predicted acyl esterase